MNTLHKIDKTEIFNNKKRKKETITYSDGISDFDGGFGIFANLLDSAAFFSDDLPDLPRRDHDSEQHVLRRLHPPLRRRLVLRRLKFVLSPALPARWLSVFVFRHGRSYRYGYGHGHGHDGHGYGQRCGYGYGYRNCRVHHRVQGVYGELPWLGHCFERESVCFFFSLMKKNNCEELSYFIAERFGLSEFTSVPSFRSSHANCVLCRPNLLFTYLSNRKREKEEE